MEEQQSFESTVDDSSLKEQLYQYLRYWPWYLLIIAIALILAHLHLRYATRIYSSQATILIKDTGNSDMSEVAAFSDLGLIGSGLSKSAFANELEILKSKDITKKVVEKLNLNIRYFYKGNVQATEVFSKKPFMVLILDYDENFRPLDLLFSIKSNTTFEMQIGEEGEKKQFIFGEKIEFPNVVISVISEFEKFNTAKNDNVIEVKISDIESMTRALWGSIQVAPINQESSIIRLSTTSPLMDKSEAILNTLIEVYNEEAIFERNQVALKTSNFIDERLNVIFKELDSVALDKVVFKEDNRLTSVEAEGTIIQSEKSVLRSQIINIGVEKELVNSYLDYLQKSDDSSPFPANLAKSATTSAAIENYNELIFEKNRLLKRVTEQHPSVEVINAQLPEYKSNILESLQTDKRALEITSKDLKRQEGRVMSQIAQLPGKEKELIDIDRERIIKESIYSYLLQKREESNISMAVATPKAKVINKAFSNRAPISPKPNSIYAGAFIAGLLLPLMFVYVRQLIDTKVHGRVDVEKKIPNIPVLGEIPNIDGGFDRETIKQNDRSILAESFRIVRTNLAYLLANTENNNKTIYVTSSIKNEGKTFVAVNLALTLKSTNKSVLLIGADIRNPQIHRYVDKPQKNKGLTEYLFDETLTVESIIAEAKFHRNTLDVIMSGRIPPNPAELLLNPRFSELLERLKNKYDYIIVDTAPSVLVSDTLLISQYADLTVYLVRAGFTDKSILRFPKELSESNKLRNVALLVNDVDFSSFGYYGSKYGYGYGYGYGQDHLDKKWYDKIFQNPFKKKKKFN